MLIGTIEVSLTRDSTKVPLPKHRDCNMHYYFDFPVTKEIQDFMQAKFDYALQYHYRAGYKECHVQKFKTREDAYTVWKLMKAWLGSFGPPASEPFEVKGDYDSWYLCCLAPGKPLAGLCKDDFFESQIMYDGKSEVLFITDFYKGVIRKLIALLWILKDRNLRFRMDLNCVYTTYDNVILARVDVQAADGINELDLVKDIKGLFNKINRKWCISGSYKAEFDFLLDNITLKEHPNKVSANAVFWTKSQRMMFLEKVLELSYVSGVKIYGKYTRDAFRKDSVSLLSRHPHMDMLFEWFMPSSKRMDFDICPEKAMQDFIEGIIYVYDNFVRLAKKSRKHRRCRGVDRSSFIQFKHRDQVVEFIQYSFPTLIGALAQRARKKNWPLGMTFEEYYSDDDFLSEEPET